MTAGPSEMRHNKREASNEPSNRIGEALRPGPLREELLLLFRDQFNVVLNVGLRHEVASFPA